MFKILIVEDEVNILNLFSRYLTSIGYNTFKAINAQEGISIISNNHIDLIVSDVMMPDMNGYEFVKEIRNTNSNIPILMVTAKDSLIDKKIGFASGIDDYMVKPIELEELGYRVEALLRRAKVVYEKKIHIGDSVIDYNSLSVINGDIVVKFSKKEFEILFKLLSHPNIIFTRRQLMDELWEYDKDSSERTVDVHIRRIRKKLGDNKDFSIDTMHSLGYRGIINNEQS